jgi:hypothetical protein
MVGRNGQRPVIARPFAYCLQAGPKETLPPFVIGENCSLEINAYFFQQYYMPFIESDYQSN